MDKLSSGSYRLLKQVNRRGADNVDTFYSIWFPTLYKLGYVDRVSAESNKVNNYVINEKGKAAIHNHQMRTLKQWLSIVILLIAAFAIWVVTQILPEVIF